MSVTYGESITVTFRGYNGTDGGGMGHEFEVDATVSLDASEPYGPTPFVMLSATTPAVINFKDVQTRSLHVSLLGGSIGVGFISGQSFTIAATDTASCSYEKGVQVTDGHVTSDTPAMPVTVKMDMDSNVPVPAIGNALYGDWSGDGRVRCASPTNDYIHDYFEAMGQREQEADLSVNESALTYTYVSPLCLEMKLRPDKSNVAKLAQSQSGVRNISKENFLLNAPSKLDDDGGSLYGTQCFDSTDQILTEGDLVSINFVGFEKYPDPSVCTWPAHYELEHGNCSVTGDYITSPSYYTFSLELLDGVAGRSQESIEDIAQAYSYDLKAGAPRAFDPFTKELIVQASRAATSATHGPVILNRHIPVLGELPEEVPRVYPVSTDPTLIFSVLRDPPGGASSTMLAETSAFGFSMSIDGLRGASRSDGSTLSLKGGIRGGGDLNKEDRRRRLTSDVLKLPNITAQTVERFANASGTRRHLALDGGVLQIIAGTCVVEYFWS